MIQKISPASIFIYAEEEMLMKKKVQSKQMLVYPGYEKQTEECVKEICVYNDGVCIYNRC